MQPTSGSSTPADHLQRAGAWSLLALRALLCAAAAYYVGAYFYIALSRWSYPYGLEWMEGGSVDHVARIVAGHSVYVAPSIDFTPYIYTPLYYWVCIPFTWLFGLGLPALRSVSLLASIGLFSFLYLLVHGSTRDRLAAFCSVGMFAATFVVGGAWLDLARVDTLYLCLLLAGLWLLSRPTPRDAWAGLLFGLAFLVKQTALMIVAPICIARFLSARGSTRLHCGLVTSVVVVISTALFDHATHGWFRYYVFDAPKAHNLEPKYVFGFWHDDILGNVPLAAALCLYALSYAREGKPLLLHWAAFLGFFGAAWASRIHHGGWDNVLLPAFLFLAWMSGEALGRGNAATRSSPAAHFAALSCLLQLGLLWYSPSAQIPTAVDRDAGAALVRKIAAYEGRVMVPFHPELVRLAGKPSNGQDMAFDDVLRGGDAEVARKLRASIISALAEKRFTAIIVDRDWWKPYIDRTYQRSSELAIPNANAFWMRTGWRIRPTDIYVPRK